MRSVKPLRLLLKKLGKDPRAGLLLWAVSATIILIGVSALILYAARLLQSSARLDHGLFPRNEDLSTLGALYQGIVGAAVALAGSLVAIKIAQLGLNTTERQERRESADFLDKIIEKGIPPLIEVIIKLSEMHYAFRIFQGTVQRRVWDPADVLYFRLPFAGHEDISGPLEGQQLIASQALNPLGHKHSIYYTHMDVPQAFSAFINAVERLADALEGVCKNAFSNAIWRRSVPDFDSRSQLRLLHRSYEVDDDVDPDFIQKVVPLWGVSAQRDLIEFALILRRQTAAVRAPENLGDVMRVKWALFDMLRLQREQNNADPTEDTLDFLELGYVLFPEGIRDRDTLHIYVGEATAFYQPNYGAAYLLDLISCFPSASELRTFLTNQYPKVFPPEGEGQVIYALEDIDLQAMLPSYFRAVKAEIDSRNREVKQSANRHWLFGLIAVPPG